MNAGWDSVVVKVSYILWEFISVGLVLGRELLSTSPIPMHMCLAYRVIDCDLLNCILG